MRHHAKLTGAATLLAILASSGCDGARPAAKSVSRLDSAGVAIVRNDSVDRPLPWTFVRRFALGGDTPDDSFGSIIREGIGEDAGGRILVLDGQNHRVLVFDSTGRLVRSQGGRGGGPGELQLPLFLVTFEDSTIGVFDPTKGGLVRYGPDGRPLSAAPPEPWERKIEAMRPIRGGLVVQQREGGAGESRLLELVLRRGATAVTLVNRPQPPVQMHIYPTCQIGLALGPIFEPQLAWDANGERVAVAAGDDYVVNVHEVDRLVLSVRRTLARRPATRELARRELGEGMKVGVMGRGGPCTIPPDEVIDARGIAPVVPAVKAVVLAPSGELWVRRGGVKGEPALSDVFTRDGTYLGTLPAAAPEPVAFLRNGDLVTIAADELDVQRIVVYRIVRDTSPALTR